MIVHLSLIFWGFLFSGIYMTTPAPREEYFAYARDLFEKKWPRRLTLSGSLEKTESLTEKGISRGEKRVNNARIKKELGVTLRHLSCKSALQSIIDQMDGHIKNVSLAHG